MLLVLGVIHEADTACSIRGVWLCYQLVQFVDDWCRFSWTSLIYWICSFPYSSFLTSVESEDQFLLNYLMKFCPVFLGSS